MLADASSTSDIRNESVVVDPVYAISEAVIEAAGIAQCLGNLGKKREKNIFLNSVPLITWGEI